MGAMVTKNTRHQLEIGGVYTTIARLRSIKGPGAEVQTAGIEAMDSGVGMPVTPTGHTKGGMVNGSILFDASGVTDQALTDLLMAPASVNWKQIWSDAKEWLYAGILKTFEPSAEVNGVVMADYSVEVNGLATYPT